MSIAGPEAVESRLARIANRVTAANAISALALIVSVAAAYYARDQAQAAKEANEIAKQAANRAAGRVGASLKIVGYTNPDAAPPALEADIGEGGQVRTIRFRTVEDLLEYNPRVYVRNAGEEPIDAIRVEVFMNHEFLNRVGLPLHRDIVRGRAFIRQSETQDFALHQKMLTNQELAVPITRCLLGQMVQVLGAKEQIAYAHFTVRLSARMVGGATFDPMADDLQSIVPFAWVIGGFPSEKCKAIYSEIQSRVEIPPPKLAP